MPSLEELYNAVQSQQEEITRLTQQVRDYQADIIEIEQSLGTKIQEQQATIEAVQEAANKAVKSQFPPGTEIIREIRPLALATDGNYIDVDVIEKWTPLTRTVYDIHEQTKSLPNSQRKYQLIIRKANNGILSAGHTSKYRLYYNWKAELENDNKPGNSDNISYSGHLNWGYLDEGSWDVITLDHILNPERHMHYWRLEGLTSGCTNRVYSVVLAIVDVLT